MDFSIFFAKLMGSYLLIIAAIMLLNKDQFHSTVKSIMSSEGLIAFSGVISLILGLAIAIAHPTWQGGWQDFITFIAYLFIFNGILRLSFPRQLKEMKESLIKNYYWVIFSVALLLGLFLTYHGWV